MTIYDAAMKYAEDEHAAGRAGGQGVRLGLVARLGGQGHEAARRARGDRGVLRAHPPLQPRRHGRAAAAVPRGRERGVARADRRGGVLDHRARRRRRPRRSPSRPTTRSSRRACGSTPRRRSSTSSTAGSCRSCCAQLMRRTARVERSPTSSRRLLTAPGPSGYEQAPAARLPRGLRRVRRGHARHRRLDGRARARAPATARCSRSSATSTRSG